MEVPVYNLAKEVVKHIEISDDVFGVMFNQSVVHQAVVRQRANLRQGTASTKTRSEVRGSSKKLFRQKGTGSARAGSIRSPLRRGGGITFGPKPRSYRQQMPKKMRQLAIRSVLSAKMGDGELIILEQLQFDEPKTKKMAQILTTLGIESSALIAMSEPGINVVKSAHNLPRIKTSPANLLNVVDILSHKMLVMTESAVRNVELLWGKDLSKGGNSASLRGVTSSADN
ncbi:MAG: 50S ribosomal protein L4 [Dehalococcoidales bacterium]|nr:50S ribosomal protein L4 [Dehalococcoidales bacterium]